MPHEVPATHTPFEPLHTPLRQSVATVHTTPSSHRSAGSSTAPGPPQSPPPPGPGPPPPSGTHRKLVSALLISPGAQATHSAEVAPGPAVVRPSPHAPQAALPSASLNWP
jgi:hypothetical protein